MDHQILELETVPTTHDATFNALVATMNRASLEAGDGPLVGMMVLCASNCTVTYDHLVHPELNEVDLIDRCIVTRQRRRDQLLLEGEG